MAQLSFQRKVLTVGSSAIKRRCNALCYSLIWLVIALFHHAIIDTSYTVVPKMRTVHADCGPVRIATPISAHKCLKCGPTDTKISIERTRDKICRLCLKCGPSTRTTSSSKEMLITTAIVRNQWMFSCECRILNISLYNCT